MEARSVVGDRRAGAAGGGGAGKFARGSRAAARRLAAAALVAAAAWGPAPEARAQAIDLIPQVGFLVPLTELGTAGDESGATFRLGKRDPSLAFGLAAEVGAVFPIGVRGGLLYATSSEVPIEGGGCTDCAARLTTMVAGAAVVARPALGAPFVRPYVLGGVAWRRHGFRDADLREAGADGAVGDRTAGAWQVGLGLELSLGLTGVLVEATDLISRFRHEGGDGKLQHELFVLVGLRL